LSIDALDKEESERNEFYRKGLNYYMLIMFSIATVIVLLSKPLLNILVPEEYHAGYVIIPWLLGASILHGAASFTNLGTVISKKTIANSIAAWTGAVLNVGLGLLLIPKYGIAGAAIGSFVAEFVFFSILWFVTNRLASVKFNVWIVASILLVYCGFSIIYLSK
jgi:O-antigen/teichoic acid export membrane protein